MMKIISITIILVIILSSTVVSFSKKAIEECITENAYGVKLSPLGNQLIFKDKDDNIVLYNIASKRIEIKYPLEGEELSIDWYEWENDTVLIHGLDKQENTRVILKTKDFKHFTTVYKDEKNEDIRIFVSNNLIKYLLHDKENNFVKINYDGNATWQTGITRNIGSQWSYDDEFLLLDNENEEVVLLNTEHRYYHVFKESYFAGVWAPSKNLYLFSNDDNDIWTKGFETGVYLFNPENKSFSKFNYNNNITTKNFIWSIDSKYIVAYDADEIDLLDADHPVKPDQELVKFNKREIRSSFLWSKDMKYLHFIYAIRTINFLKPFSYYAARINLETKNIESIYIGGLITSDSIKWTDENSIIYEKGNDNCLYRLELKW